MSVRRWCSAGVAGALVLSGSVLMGGAAQAKGGEVGGSGEQFFLANSFAAEADTVFRYGAAGDEFFVGDWDGDGDDTLAYRRGATFFVRNSNSTGAAETSFTYGRSGDVVLVGDWDGDGVDTLAVRRGATYYVKNSLRPGSADKEVRYGRAGDTVLVGDWDGDRDDTFAVRRGATYYVNNTIRPGAADKEVRYGRAGDTVLVGDWDGDRDDTFAVRRGITYYAKNTIAPGNADVQANYGRASDTALVGDWNGDRKDTLGLRRAAATSSVQSVHAGGQPGAKNTGVPAGVSLRVHNGDLTITKPGTVIDGLDVRGYVRVRAKDVVIRNSIIRGGAAGKQDALVKVIDSGASLLIEDSELVAANPNPGIDGLRGWGITARRLNIHGVIDGGHFWGNNVTIEDSWIHDNLHYDNDPHHSDGSHDDGIQIQKGSNIKLVGNTIEGAYNAAVMITQDQSRTSNVTISGNWLDGGKCTVNLAEKGRGPFQGISIVDNKFGRVVHNTNRDACAVIYPGTSTLSLRNNVYADNGSAAKIRRN